MDEIGGRAVEGGTSERGWWRGWELQTKKRRPGRGFSLSELMDWDLCDSGVVGRERAKRNGFKGCEGGSSVGAGKLRVDAESSKLRTGRLRGEVIE